MAKEAKTNAMRMLDRQKVKYVLKLTIQFLSIIMYMRIVFKNNSVFLSITP